MFRLVPPSLEKNEQQKVTLTEGEQMTLACPVVTQGQWPDLSWTKDGRPLDPASLPEIRVNRQNMKLKRKRIEQNF